MGIVLPTLRALHALLIYNTGTSPRKLPIIMDSSIETNIHINTAPVIQTPPDYGHSSRALLACLPAAVWESEPRPDLRESGRNRAYGPLQCGKKKKYKFLTGIKPKTYQTLGSALSSTLGVQGHFTEFNSRWGLRLFCLSNAGDVHVDNFIFHIIHVRRRWKTQPFMNVILHFFMKVMYFVLIILLGKIDYG